MSFSMRQGMLLKIAFWGYVVFLTLLLLSADPVQVMGGPAYVPGLCYDLMSYAHLLSFSVLTVLALAAHSPLPRWVLVAGLIAYGAMTEGLQGLLPPRTPDWADWLQNVAGVVGGVACYYALAFLIKRIYTASRPNMGSAKPADL